MTKDEILERVRSATPEQLTATHHTFTELARFAERLTKKVSNSRYTNDLTPRAGMTLVDIRQILEAVDMEVKRRDGFRCALCDQRLMDAEVDDALCRGCRRKLT